ncbi:MAG TPA: VWA-like domain-containing protein [Stellaceae bacterium]|nr:VWA-like domain-containing protein [Stellaceae bacterium]
MNNHQSAAELAISRARAALILDAPFFGSLALRLQPVASDRTKTMATDGHSLFYNGAWLESLKPNELCGLISHEVMHLAMTHHCRRGHRDPRKWNVAADEAINPLLVDAGFTLPAGRLMNPAYRGLAAEQIYARLPADQGGGSGGKGAAGASGEAGDDEPAPGEVWDAPAEDGAPAPSDATLAAEEANWKAAVLQAAQSAKAAGNCPGFARDLAAKIRAPQVDWRDQLRRYMTATQRNDYSWRKPNVRFLASGDYLPSLHSESAGTIALWLDTSGSISAAEANAFLAEVNAIAEEVRPELLHVGFFHSAVYRQDEYQADDYPISLGTIETGGTRFSPLWPATPDDAVCAIVLTDLCCDDFGTGPDAPVLWISTTARDRVPFGEVVRLEVDG